MIVADILSDSVKKENKERGGANITVLAIPRGGVIVADALASKFTGSTFDIAVPRKLGAPNNQELAMGAVMQDRTTYLNKHVMRSLQITETYLEAAIEEQVQEIQRRMSLYRQASKPYDLKDRTVVVVDDGIATGATLMVVIRWVKKYEPMRILVAVPVAPKDSVADLTAEGVDVSTVITPSSFSSVGQFYEKFDQVTDEEVVQVAKKWGLIKTT